MGSPYAIAALWIGLAFAAALISIRTWIAVSLVEILVASTTSVVVYAVLVETGLNETSLGRVILAACFVADLGTVLALGLLFAHYNSYLLAFVIATAGAGLIALFLLVKMASKFVGVRPLAGAFRLPAREAMYTRLLMSTGLTFGTISALFGLSHRVIDGDQYAVLVTVVILGAFVPTLIAQAVLPTEGRGAPGPWRRATRRSRAGGLPGGHSRMSSGVAVVARFARAV